MTTMVIDAVKIPSVISSMVNSLPLLSIADRMLNAKMNASRNVVSESSITLREEVAAAVVAEIQTAESSRTPIRPSAVRTA